MKNDPGNRDLAEAFATLKAEDLRMAPPFEIPEVSPGKQRRWRAGPALSVAGFAGAVAAAVTGLFLAISGPGDDKPAGEPIAFDQLSEVISRELFVASVGEWESPTSFLLNPELLRTNPD